MESLLIILIVFAIFMFFQSRSARKRADQQMQDREEQMVPGAWVMTSAGFYGRFVDRDGQVIILETPDGHETYWNDRAVREVVDALPFGADEAEGQPAGGAGAVIDVDPQDSAAPTNAEHGKRAQDAAKTDADAEAQTSQSRDADTATAGENDPDVDATPRA